MHTIRQKAFAAELRSGYYMVFYGIWTNKEIRYSTNELGELIIIISYPANTKGIIVLVISHLGYCLRYFRFFYVEKLIWTFQFDRNEEIVLKGYKIIG